MNVLGNNCMAVIVNSWICRTKHECLLNRGGNNQVAFNEGIR